MDKMKTKRIYKIYEQIETEIKNKIVDSSGGQNAGPDGSDKDNKIKNMIMTERFYEFVTEFFNKNITGAQGYLNSNNINREEPLPKKVKEFSVQLVEKIL